MLWIKAFHIIAVICWFSAIFYLPRLYVYHALSDDQISIDRFMIMESKLFWGIMTPSADATEVRVCLRTAGLSLLMLALHDAIKRKYL